MTGNRNMLLQFVGLMNSSLFDWYLKLTTEAEVQGGGIQLYVTTLEKTLLKLDFDAQFSNDVEKRLQNLLTDAQMDDTVFKAYGLTPEEADFIRNCKQAKRA